jgi:hypothetical protein
METSMHPARKIENLKTTIRVISPGLLSKFRSANNLVPKYMKTSSWTNNIIKTPKENDASLLWLPPSIIDIVTASENIRNVTWERGFRRLRKSYNLGLFILTNLVVLY